MNSLKIVVVDFGLGNLFSVHRALEYCGAKRIYVTSSISDISTADRLILPGVGAFEDGIKGLKDRNLVDPIIKFADSGKPLLGICLGMQLLASESEEFGAHEGLTFIPRRVVRIPKEINDGQSRKGAFIGWANLSEYKKQSWQDTPLSGLTYNDAVYLVHTYHLIPNCDDSVIAQYDHRGYSVTAAVRKGCVFGLQFHPEKSGLVGLKIISNFLSLPC